MAELRERASRWLIDRVRAIAARLARVGPREERRLGLLYKLTALPATLELDELLPAVAQLSIPELADWSAVDVPREALVRRLYVGHRNPRHAELAARLKRFTPWRDRVAWNQLLAGRSILVSEVTEGVLRANTQNEEHFALIRQLRCCSMIAVPLRLRDATVAVLTFTTTAESGRRYGPDDLALAEEVARRAGLIINLAGLHADLKASDGRLRAALAMSRTAVFEQDRELRYRWVYNFPTGDDILGKTHADVYPPDVAAELDRVKSHLIKTGEPMRGYVRGTGGDASTVRMLALDPLRDQSGAIVGLVGASTDLTEEKQMQEELAQAVRFRERLMGILGHDLRNPLGAITMADGLLLRRHDLPPAASDLLLRIRRSADRMQEMINTLLDFTRVRSGGRLPVSPVPADLAEIAHGVLDELREIWPGRDLRLEARGDSAGRWDPARMAQVISNLAGNALAYGDPGTPVRVSVEDPGEEVVLTVRNQGRPIPADLMPVLFEPFRRGLSEEGSPGGLGLGLYIVQQIVQAHGGTIDVASTAQEGTTFSVRLPRAASSPQVHETMRPTIH